MAITEAADRQTNQDNMNVEQLSTRNGQYGRLFLYDRVTMVNLRSTENLLAEPKLGWYKLIN